jgi:hypothetical protein
MSGLFFYLYSMKKTEEYIFVEVEALCEKPDEGFVYVCYNERRMDLLCPCGCGALISLNTLADAKPCWKFIEYDGITPSIRRESGCRSHFTITHGIVRMY